MPTSGTEKRLQSLRIDFHPGKLRLLIRTAAIRRIPVTVVFLLPPRCAGHAPVGDFVQGTAKIIMAIANLVGVAWQVNRFTGTAYQHGVVGIEKSRPKQALQLTTDVPL